MIRTNKSESGVAFVELALVVPLLVFLVFAALEYSRTFKHLQISAALSREAASIAYRDCGGDEEERVTGCLLLVRNQVEAYSRNIQENAGIVVSVYEKGSDGIVRRLGISSGSYESKFSASGTEISGIENFSRFSDHRRIVIAESYLPFVGIAPFVGGLFDTLSNKFYDATII